MLESTLGTLRRRRLLYGWYLIACRMPAWPTFSDTCFL